jgi:hypothetical protein
MLFEARPRPHVLDDYTVRRVSKLYGEQALRRRALHAASRTMGGQALDPGPVRGSDVSARTDEEVR